MLIIHGLLLSGCPKPHVIPRNEFPNRMVLPDIITSYSSECPEEHILLKKLPDQNGVEILFTDNCIGKKILIIQEDNQRKEIELVTKLYIDEKEKRIEDERRLKEVEARRLEDERKLKDSEFKRLEAERKLKYEQQRLENEKNLEMKKTEGLRKKEH
jgi:hypothetical protein